MERIVRIREAVMAAQYDLKNISNKHMAIIEHMCANPMEKLGDVARAFGVGRAWLSRLIHSDLFQAKLAERQDECFIECAMPLRSKIHNLAHETIDKLTEKVEAGANVSELQTIAELALDATGYGAKKKEETSPTVVVNIDSESLASARNKIGRTFDGESVTEVSASGERGAGLVESERAGVSEAQETGYRSQAQGNSL